MGLDYVCPTTYVAQNIECSYYPMLELPPDIPPPDSAANLYHHRPCQGYALQGEKYNLA